MRDILRQRTSNISELPVDDGGLVLDEAVLKESDLFLSLPVTSAQQRALCLLYADINCSTWQVSMTC